MGDFEQVQYSPAQLDELLRNSFQAIRRDIEQLRSAESISLGTIADLRARLEELREELVSKGKYNVQQIRIHELEEDIEELRKMEKEIEQYVDKHITSVYNEFGKTEKRLKERVKDFEKRGKEDLKAHKQNIDTNLTLVNKKLEENLIRLEEKLRNHVNHINEKTTKEFKGINKQLASFSQIKAEYVKMSAAAAEIRIGLAKLEKKGGDIFETRSAEFARQIEAHIQQIQLGLAKTVQEQHKAIETMRKHVEGKISRSQVEKLTDDINREFGGLKDLITREVTRIDKEFEEKGKFVKSKRIDRVVTEINDEFDRLKDKVSFMENSKLSKPSFDQHMEEIKADIQNLKEEFMILKKDALTRSERSASLREELKQAPKIMPKPRVYRRTGLAASVLLVVGFTLLILSIATFYTGYPTTTIILVALGLVSAIIGTILKVIVALRNKEQ